MKQKTNRFILIFLIITSIIAFTIGLMLTLTNYIYVYLLIMALGLFLLALSLIYEEFSTKLKIGAYICYIISFLWSAFIIKGFIGMLLTFFALMILISVYFILTKSKKNGTFLIIFIITVGITGFMGTKNIHYNFIYDLNEDDHFIYNLSYSTTMQNKTVETPMQIEMWIINTTNDTFHTQAISRYKKDGKEIENSYSTLAAINGKIIEAQFETPAIPEIQMELPNFLPYPEKEVKKGETWIIPIQKTGTLLFENSSMTKYELLGIKKYTFTGLKSTYVKGGKFECAVIESYINATLNMNITLI